MTPDRIVQPFAVLFGVAVISGLVWLVEWGALHIADPNIPAWTGNCVVEKVGITDRENVTLFARCDGSDVQIVHSRTVADYLYDNLPQDMAEINCTKYVTRVLGKVSYGCRVGK